MNDLEARAAVLTQLALSFDHFVDEERSERRQGHEAAAEGAHRVSIWLLRAYAAERDDPTPQGDTLKHVGP